MFVRHIVYEDPLMGSIAKTLNSLIWQLVFAGAIHIIINWLGYKFVKAEIPRIGNEAILNGLKEGVFVLD